MSSEPPQSLAAGATEPETSSNGNPGDFEELGKKIKGELVVALDLPVFSLELFFLYISQPLTHLYVFSCSPLDSACAQTEQINPQIFEGCKISLGKGLSRYFQTTHTVVLGSSTQPANYQYGVTYVGSKKIAENDVSDML